ncbi:MAG: glycosyltransferase [Actinomycetota bacterium]
MPTTRILTISHFDPDPVVNGFTSRYESVVSAARLFGNVEQLSIGPIGSGASIEVDPVVFTTDRRGRLQRMRCALGLGGPLRSARRVLAAAASERDIGLVLGFTYMNPELLGALAKAVPTYAFVEERPKSFGYQSSIRSNWWSRVAATVERSALRRLLGPVRSIVVIQPGEVAAAEARWHRHATVIPHAVASLAPLENNEGEGQDILCVGNFVERRNAEGLRSILDALDAIEPQSAAEVAVISRSGIARELTDYQGERLIVKGGVADLAPEYSRATIVLVPSFVAWGAKTTILQGWSARRPVVTTTEAAMTVGGVNGETVLAGSTPAEVATLLVALLNDRQLQRDLAEAGFAHVRRAHGQEAIAEALRELILGGQDE